MKTKFVLIALLLTSFLSFNSKANTGLSLPLTDSCCRPINVRINSTSYPQFCMSWRVLPDTSCTTPQGYMLEWKNVTSSGPWTQRTVIYTGGIVINFCDYVSECGTYEFRMRTICDSTNGVFSVWAYAANFTMTNCLQGKPVLNKNKHQISDAGNNNINNYAALLKPKEE